MNLETVLALARATGRTLVLPPRTHIWKSKKVQTDNFSVLDYFTVDQAMGDTKNIISMEDYLKMQLTLASPLLIPPNNRTNWDNAPKEDMAAFQAWMRNSTVTPNEWRKNECMLGFPASSSASSSSTLQDLLPLVKSANKDERLRNYLGNPVHVDADPVDRLDEVLVHRTQLCEYSMNYQTNPHLHLRGDSGSPTRLLTHFYAFLFFEDWKQDLWTKRLIRDKMRFIDAVQCAAARIVQELRTKGDAEFDAIHIRRGDFDSFYKDSQMTAQQIYDNVKDVVQDGSTVYIATDEKDTTFFNVFRDHYKVYFLKDFEHLFQGVNPEYYGMIEQRVASRAREFAGCFYSTFSGYIHRMRGYHSQNDPNLSKQDGALVHSWYYVPLKEKDSMQGYYPLVPNWFSREFPIAWRDLNKGID